MTSRVLGSQLCATRIFALASPLLLAPTVPILGWAAGECDCEHLIEPETPSATSTELGVGPGDSVCVRGGAREFLRLYDLVGSADVDRDPQLRRCGRDRRPWPTDSASSMIVAGLDFVEYDTRTHHNWITDTTGEGSNFTSTAASRSTTT